MLDYFFAPPFFQGFHLPNEYAQSIDIELQKPLLKLFPAEKLKPSKNKTVRKKTVTINVFFPASIKTPCIIISPSHVKFFRRIIRAKCSARYLRDFGPNSSKKIFYFFFFSYGMAVCFVTEVTFTTLFPHFLYFRNKIWPLLNRGIPFHSFFTRKSYLRIKNFLPYLDVMCLSLPSNLNFKKEHFVLLAIHKLDIEIQFKRVLVKKEEEKDIDISTQNSSVKKNSLHFNVGIRMFKHKFEF